MSSFVNGVLGSFPSQLAMFSGGHRGPFRGTPNRPGLLPEPNVPGRQNDKARVVPARTRPYNTQTPRGRSFNSSAPRIGFTPRPRFPVNEGASTSSQYQTRSPHFGNQQCVGRAPYESYESPNSGLTDNFMRLRNPKQSFSAMNAYSNTPYEDAGPKTSEFDDIPSGEWSANNLEEVEPVDDDVTMDSGQSTIHIVTVTPTSLKKINYKDSTNELMFEIFGTVSSSVTKGSFNSKHFCLSSNNDVIPCVFYEIDRPLGNIIRNELYRCIGYYEPKGNVKCLSVRPASAPEKAHMNQMLTQIPDSEP